MRRMNKKVIRDRYGWLYKKGFLKAYDVRFIVSKQVTKVVSV